MFREPNLQSCHRCGILVYTRHLLLDRVSLYSSRAKVAQVVVCAEMYGLLDFAFFCATY